MSIGGRLKDFYLLPRCLTPPAKVCMRTGVSRPCIVAASIRRSISSAAAAEAANITGALRVSVRIGLNIHGSAMLAMHTPCCFFCSYISSQDRGTHLILIYADPQKFKAQKKAAVSTCAAGDSSDQTMAASSKSHIQVSAQDCFAPKTAFVFHMFHGYADRLQALKAVVICTCTDIMATLVLEQVDRLNIVIGYLVGYLILAGIFFQCAQRVARCSSRCQSRR